MGIRKSRKRKIAIVIALVCLVSGELLAQGRQVRFQTENPQAYTLIWEGKEYEANERGEVLITELQPGRQQFRFEPRQGAHYFIYTMEMGFADQFLLLRLPTDGNWVVFDPVSFNSSLLERGGMKERKLPLPPVAMQEPLMVKEAEKPVARPVIVKEVVKEPLKPRPLPVITRLYERAGNEGVDMVFEVRDGEQRDTVVLFVPVLTQQMKGAASGNSIKKWWQGTITAIEIKQTDAIFHRSSLRRNGV